MAIVSTISMVVVYEHGYKFWDTQKNEKKNGRNLFSAEKKVFDFNFNFIIDVAELGMQSIANLDIFKFC